MSTSVSGEEYESMALVVANEELIGGFAECGFDGDPLSVLETVDVVKSGAADYSDCVFHKHFLSWDDAEHLRDLKWRLVYGENGEFV